MSTDFLDYALSLSPGLLHVYSLGHLHDLSGNDIASTFVGTPGWARSRYGHQLHARATGNLSLGDPASCRATTDLVVAAFGAFARLEAGGRIAAKRSGAAAATCDYDLFLANTPAISLFDGVTTSTLNVDYRGADSITARVADGAAPSFFLDGVLVGVGGAVLDVDDDGNTLYVLAREGGADRLVAPLNALLVFADTVITDEQISDLHRLYTEDARGVPTAPARTISLPPRDENGALLYLAGPKNALDNVVDRSGNGLDAAVAGRVGEEREHVSGARVQHFHGAGAGIVSVPASAVLTGHAGQTYSGLVRVDGDGEGGEGRIFSLDDAGAVRTELLTRNVNDLRFSRMFADGRADWDVAVRPGNGLTHHLVVRHDGDPTHLPTGLVNGQAATFAVSTGRVGALTSDVGAILKVGNRNATDRALDGAVGRVKLHGSPLSDVVARAEYLQHGTRAIELAPRRAYPITPTWVASGSCGPWSVVRGSWQYQDDNNRRNSSCAGTDDVCAAPSAQAYGAWYWRAGIWRATGSYHRVAFIASQRSGLAVAGQNAYAVYVNTAERVSIYCYTGAANVVLFSSPNGYVETRVEYEWFVTRDYTGLFTLYIRGGTFAVWTVVGSAVHNTHTKCNFLVNHLWFAGDWVSGFVFYPLGDTLDPRTEVPGLED